MKFNIVLIASVVVFSVIGVERFGESAEALTRAVVTDPGPQPAR